MNKMIFSGKNSGYLFAMLAAIMFGAVPVIAKPLTSSVNPFVLSSITYLCAFFAFIPLTQKSKTHFKKNDYVILITIGVGSAFFSPILYFIGLEQSSATDASLLSNAEIVFTVLLAVLFFKEKLNLISYLSIILVLVGVGIISTNLNFEQTIGLDFGNLLILGSTALWALDNNLSRIISERINTARIVQIKYGIGGVLMVVTILIFQIRFQLDYSLLPQIVLLSLVGFAGALYFFLLSLKRIGTIRTIAIFSMSSVFGLIFSTIFLNEQISVYQIFAISIMLLGIYIINKKSHPTPIPGAQTN